MLTTERGVRLLGSADLRDFLALTAQDPVVNVFAEYRARMTNLMPKWLGGQMWGRYVDGKLVAACHSAANLVPVQATAEDAEAFAERAADGPRTAATIVGPEEPVEALWSALSSSWQRPREFRLGQPHLQIDHDPLVRPDPTVRLSAPHEIDIVYPACVAMYTEEVGVSPEVVGSDLYLARIKQLIERRWSYVRIEGDAVVFKAEVAAATEHAAQIQGVWVAPERRGEGLAISGMAAVVADVRRRIAPAVSLYVNEWNTPARATYARVGFRETARFATIMW